MGRTTQKNSKRLKCRFLAARAAPRERRAGRRGPLQGTARAPPHTHSAGLSQKCSHTKRPPMPSRACLARRPQPLPYTYHLTLISIWAASSFPTPTAHSSGVEVGRKRVIGGRLLISLPPARATSSRRGLPMVWSEHARAGSCW